MNCALWLGLLHYKWWHVWTMLCNLCGLGVLRTGIVTLQMVTCMNLALWLMWTSCVTHWDCYITIDDMYEPCCVTDVELVCYKLGLLHYKLQHVWTLALWLTWNYCIINCNMHELCCVTVMDLLHYTFSYVWTVPFNWPRLVGGLFLACKDFGRMFDHSFPACMFCFVFWSGD